MGLATGATMNPIFDSLVRRHREAGLSFSRVRAFHLDEYWPLKRDDTAGFAASLEARFIGKVDFLEDSFTPFPPSTVSAGVEKSCAAYCKAIAMAGGINLQVVGVGVNGHLAFNEPGSEVDSRARKVNLAPETLARMPDGVNYNEALTLGIADILEAKEILFVATGADKSKAVQRALKVPPSADCPASFLQKHPSVTWLIDVAAASLLQG